jgi:hypothetical protein
MKTKGLPKLASAGLIAVEKRPNDTAISGMLNVQRRECFRRYSSFVSAQLPLLPVRATKPCGSVSSACRHLPMGCAGSPYRVATVANTWSSSPRSAQSTRLAFVATRAWIGRRDRMSRGRMLTGILLHGVTAPSRQEAATEPLDRFVFVELVGDRCRTKPTHGPPRPCTVSRLRRRGRGRKAVSLDGSTSAPHHPAP